MPVKFYFPASNSQQASFVTDHLSDNIDPIAFTTSDFSNKLILDGDGGGLGSDMAVITFDASGTGEFL